MSHVTDTALQAFVVRFGTLPVHVAICPGATDVLSHVSGIAVDAPVPGQVGLPANTVSVATQFARLAPSGLGGAGLVFITWTTTSFVFFVGSCDLHVFVTVSPGVSHWNFAMSLALATRFASGTWVQKQLRLTVSGSSRVPFVSVTSAWLHVWLTSTG